MNSGLELHDSVLAGLERVGEDLVICLAPAYVHRSEGRPGWDPGTGWAQEVELVIAGADPPEAEPALPCALASGSLASGSLAWENVLPLPLASSGPVELRLVTERGEALTVRGRSVRVEARGEASPVERFPAPG